MIAATLIDENQNSNSPYERADSRLTAVMTAISTRPICHTGSAKPELQDLRTGNGLDRHDDDPEIPVQPARDEARRRCRARARVNSVNERMCGCVSAISPSMRITMKTIAPARMYEISAAGPAAAIAALLPTKSPAPITPPIVIIVMWRGSRVRLSS